MSAPLAICGATALQRRDRWRATPDLDVVMESGRIVACAPRARDAYPQAQRIDGRALLLTPGIVNAHCHSAEVLSRGRASQSALQAWLDAAMPPIDALCAEDLALAINLCAVDMLRSGVTAVIDHFRQMPTSLKATEVAATAWSDTSLRCMVAMMVRDGVSADGRVIDAGHAGAPPTTAEIINLCRTWIEGGTAQSKVVRALGPSAPVRCTEALLKSLGELSRETGAPIHMHVDETSDQAQAAQKRFGASAISALERLGVLGPATSLVHCVHLLQSDHGILARSGALAVHCPVANLRLGSGVSPAAAMHHNGVAMALATDGAASNDAQCMTEVIKTALLLSRLNGEPAAWLSPDDVLDMAFKPGPRAFLKDMDPLNGAISVGAPADIAAFDLTDPLLVPANDLAAQMTFSGGALRARHVWVGGEQLLRDGEPTKIDRFALAAQASRRLSEQRTAP